MQIKNENTAVKIVLQQLRKNGYSWQHIQYVNKGRYAIIKSDNNVNIAILLKTEPFFNFGEKFAEFGCKGVGDSINLEHLRLFLQKDIKTIFTIFRDGKIYFISLIDFLKKSYVWVQKEGTTVRSISIHEYKRYECKV